MRPRKTPYTPCCTAACRDDGTWYRDEAVPESWHDSELTYAGTLSGWTGETPTRCAARAIRQCQHALRILLPCHLHYPYTMSSWLLLLQYRGSRAKTSSNKASRVGQAAKKQRGQKRDTS